MYINDDCIVLFRDLIVAKTQEWTEKSSQLSPLNENNLIIDDELYGLSKGKMMAYQDVGNMLSFLLQNNYEALKNS